jgi:hypothetical protein
MASSLAPSPGGPNGTAAMSWPVACFNWCHPSIRPTCALAFRPSGMPDREQAGCLPDLFDGQGSETVCARRAVDPSQELSVAQEVAGVS